MRQALAPVLELMRQAELQRDRLAELQSSLVARPAQRQVGQAAGLLRADQAQADRPA